MKNEFLVSWHDPVIETELARLSSFFSQLWLQLINQKSMRDIEKFRLERIHRWNFVTRFANNSDKSILIYQLQTETDFIHKFLSDEGQQQRWNFAIDAEKKVVAVYFFLFLRQIESSTSVPVANTMNAFCCCSVNRAKLKKRCRTDFFFRGFFLSLLRSFHTRVLICIFIISISP